MLVDINKAVIAAPGVGLIALALWAIIARGAGSGEGLLLGLLSGVFFHAAQSWPDDLI